MTPTWAAVPPPPRRPLGLRGWARALPRGVALAMAVFGGLVLLLAVRLVERPKHGTDRPWTPRIAQGTCRAAIAILGLRHRVRGAAMRVPGAVVANHSSWLDIFALNAAARVCFVSKSEVAGWPGIGWLARATGTVFIRRHRSEARAQAALFEERLGAGHRLLFFPEGTSSDGQRVLPFKTSLFAAFLSERLRDRVHVQPVTVIWRAPAGDDPRFYAWWGDMALAPHLLKILAAPRQGEVEVVFHPPVRVAEFTDRKRLAAHVERAVRAPGVGPEG